MEKPKLSKEHQVSYMSQLETHMQQVQERQMYFKVGDSPHVYIETVPLTIDQWIAAGRPYNWTLEERLMVKGRLIEVLIDVGYGGIALFINGTFAAFGKKNIVFEDLVILDKEYYQVSKLIWI
jgi:hypothetical protein